MNRALLATLSMGLLMACGGANKPTTGKTEKAESPKSTWEPPPLPEDGAIKLIGLTGPKDKAWDKMSYDEKEWYMIGNVHPVMRQIFQTYNAKKYEGEKFECAPCHGENGKEKKYKMPSDHLSPIPEFGSAEWKEMENARMFKFMTKRVTPAMGQLLGKEPWDHETGEGYSCWGCHPKAE